jgi:hypothetical protein
MRILPASFYGKGYDYVFFNEFVHFPTWSRMMVSCYPDGGVYESYMMQEMLEFYQATMRKVSQLMALYAPEPQILLSNQSHSRHYSSLYTT